MSAVFTYRRLDRNQAAVLLVDHQSGLCNLVGDFSPDNFKNNVLALAGAAKYFQLPTILTTSFETGPNGPLVPELEALFPDVPYIARPGQINAWDNEDFVTAIEAGYEVFCCTEASGTFNHTTRDAVWHRMQSAGVQLMSWFGIACELHRDWRNDIDGLGALFSNHLPAYRNLISSYNAHKQ
ncbi:MAG: hydrolase [Planctomycetaceae bacterium]